MATNMDITFFWKCLIVGCILIIFVGQLTNSQQGSQCTRFEMRKDLTCHVLLTTFRATDLTTCMRHCTDDCHGLIYNEFGKTCTSCASVKFETGNPEKNVMAYEKVPKQCGAFAGTSEKCRTDVCPPFDNNNNINGKVEGDTLFEGATRTFTCNPGYSPIDLNSAVSQCKNGKWSNITECVRVCPPFENKSNGTVEGDSLFEGATRNMTCSPGYSPRDINAVVSQCHDGQWANITECVREECVLNQETYGGSTYTFAIRSRRNYNDSVAFCQHCGFRLVTIESEDEHRFLADKMSRVFPTPTRNNDWSEFDGFFVDFYETGGRTFRMDNDSQVLFTKFYTDEPNDEADKFIAAVGLWQWQWADVFPGKKIQTVCENEN